MLNDFTVDVVYKNKDMQRVNERVYTLVDYCKELKLNILHTLMDIQSVYYQNVGENWNPKNDDSFQKIRHKLLDSANSIERLPLNMKVKGRRADSMGMGEFIANKVKEMS